MVNWILAFGRVRILTHAVLALFTVTGLYATQCYLPYASTEYIFTVGFAYLALLLITLTLAVGTLNLLRQSPKRRQGPNPVNIDLRRDIGIWAGLTGLLHGVFGFTIHFNGEILAYFVDLETLQPRTNLFGISNYLGAVATIVLTVLLTTSNTFSLRKLKGKRWKLLQRLNYLLAVLVFIHTFAYQTISHREKLFVTVTVGLAALLLIAQAAGFIIHRQVRKPSI